MSAIAEHLLETKRGDFDPAYLEDWYRTVSVEKLREKQAEVPARSVAPAPSGKNVINLMESLKRSLAAEQRAHTGAGESMRPGAMALVFTADKVLVDPKTLKSIVQPPSVVTLTLVSHGRLFRGFS